MASTYTRKDSPFIHLRFKDADGRWKGRPTGFRKDNMGHQRQAELLARSTTEDEKMRAVSGESGLWEDWVVKWMNDRYRGKETTTLAVYRRHWRKLSLWLQSEGLHDPRQVAYRHSVLYRDARLRDGASSNTVLHELKFLSVVMQEAVRREFAPGNPFLRLGLKKDKPKEKVPWTDEEILRVSEAVRSQSQFLRATFLLGLYQAARLRQCAVPLSDIDLQGRRITYRKTKGDKPFTQPIDPRCVGPLSALVAEREAAGHNTLCDIPVLPSVDWRRFLDSLGLFHLVHHGLRVTWITRAALSRGAVSQPEAKRFVNHGSTAVHALYQKLNAEDLAHVPAAMNLPTVPGSQIASPANPDSERGSSSGGDRSGADSQG